MTNCKNNNAMKKFTIILASITLLASCEHLGPYPNKKMKMVPADDPSEVVAHETVFDQLSNKGLEDADSGPKDEFYRGTGRFVNPVVKSGKPKKSSATGKFTLNFEDAALSEVIKVILSDTLGESYMVNPKVVGKVTLQTSRPLTREELLPTLELLLQVNNAALIKDGTMFRIEPLSSALKAGVNTSVAGRGKGPSAGYQVQIMPLQYVGVEEMREILEPMVSGSAILRADKARNLLMVAGTAKELESIKQTVSTFDVDYMSGMSFGIFTLKNSDVETLNKELEAVYNLAEGSPMAGMFKLVPIERMNAILAITPQPRYLDKIKLWINRLDRAVGSAGGGVIVYRCQHVKADELAATLNEIFTGREKKTKEPTVAAGRKATKISSRNKKTKTKTKKTTRRISSSRKSSAPDISGIGDVRIIADEPNNSIVIVATPQEYETIKAVIKELDVMPLQVLIEATIIEVRLSEQTKYGVSWGLGTNRGVTSSTDKDGNITEAGGSGAARGMAQLGQLAAAAASGASTGGFSYVISNVSNTVQAAIDAFGVDDNINVLSTPSLMVLNNQEAIITVGNKVPTRTNEVTNLGAGVSNTTAVNSGIESTDTGVKLKVTPRVNANGVVIMEIEQSVKEATETKTSNIDSPTILNREINTTVAIYSGETVVLGGLIDETYSDVTTGIPWLKDLPYVGVLFGETDRKKRKSELIVLITPKVVQNKADARRETRKYQLRLPGLYEIDDNLKDISGELKQIKQKQNLPN